MTTAPVQLYEFAPAFEAIVVLYLCTTPKFYASVGRAIEHELFNTDPARLAAKAAHAVFVDTGRGPSAAELVTQRARRWMDEGTVTKESLDALVDYLFDVTATALPPMPDVLEELRPILQRRLQVSAVRVAMEDYANRRDFARTEKLLHEAKTIGKLDKSPGVTLGRGTVSRFAALAQADRLSTGITELDVGLGGGLRRGKTAMVIGGKGCLHGDTPIHDPVDGTTLSVRERWQRAVPFHVWALGPHGPVIAAAMPPERYASTGMVRVVCETGTVVVTPAHRFLAGAKAEWVTAAQIGEQLSALRTARVCEPSSLHEFLDASVDHAQPGVCHVLLASSSDSALRVHARDATRWMQTTQDFQDDYPQGRRCDDVQLPADQDTVRAPVPSQDDAHERSHCDSHADGQEGTAECNRSCPLRALPSKTRFSSCEHPDDAGCLQPRPPRLSPDSHSFQARQQPLQETPPARTVRGPSADAPVSSVSHELRVYLPATLPCSQPCHASDNGCVCIHTRNVGAVQALAVEPVDAAPYYDFHVPVFNNYWACGLWHHNSGKSHWLTHVACVALRRGLYVLEATLELDECDQEAHALANLLDIPTDAILDNSMPDVINAKIEALLPTIGPFEVKFFPPKHTNMRHIADWKREREDAMKRKADVLIVDYIDKLGSTNPKHEREYDVQGQAAEDMRVLVLEDSMWGWTASQPRRPDMKAKERRLGKDDGADSQGKVRALDLICTTYAPSEGEREIYVAANRNGRADFAVGPFPHKFSHGQFVARGDSLPGGFDRYSL